MFYYTGHFAKLLIAWIDLIIFSLAMWLLAWLPAPLRGWYPKLYQRWNWCFVRAMGIDLHIHQHYSGSLPERYMVVANHPSALEDIGIPAVFPVRAIAKIECKDWWFVGRIAKAADTIFVAREDKKSRRQAAETTEARLREGACIAVFPEGGCFGRKLRDFFHYGSFEIAHNTDTPIVPTFIHYEAEEDFEWLEQTLPQKIWEILTTRNHTVHFHIYDPIDPRLFNGKEALTNHVYGLFVKWQELHLGTPPSTGVMQGLQGQSEKTLR